MPDSIHSLSGTKQNHLQSSTLTHTRHMRTVVAVALAATAAAYNDTTTVHLVYSTGCTQPQRQFLSASLQLSLVRVKHQGPLTEIISGCTAEQKATVLAQPTFYPDFRFHFTEDYAKYESPTFTEHYTPYNKPFGLRDFLRHAEPQDELAVAFIDVDFMLLKPLQINTGAAWGKYYQRGTRPADEITDRVENGFALAQNMKAFLGERWFNDRNRTILNLVCEGQPCANVSTADAFEYFEPTGSPYIMTRHDWHRVVEDYVAFVVKGREVSDRDDWMVEMYAYGAAVANQNVKHTIVKHLGPATPEFQTTEYWQFVDETTANPCADPFTVVLPEDPPVGIHYAMHYGLSDKHAEGFQYTKHNIPYDILDCNGMLFKLPPPTEWTDIPAKFPDDPAKQFWKRHAIWLECTLLKYGNQVLKAMKTKLCPRGFNSHQGLVLKYSETPPTALAKLD
ncbi:Aste57867_4151 [Aphanomyces stellatus]|uniref:Aste57867_4151 protein n=1 Tax=Aphanomyces stellatus TaxID=120398 RepID=A0A485KF10_9STRA|nr:hypothetical protein As57867_004140 [Aphanomyces stellatus]VFT81278.1 Aste57867_4151 [Aphanomyces stellatus]